MKRSFQIGQIVEIRIIDKGFNPEDYYIVSIVAIHGSVNEVVYYTSNPKDAYPCRDDGKLEKVDLDFVQSRHPLCLVSNLEIEVKTL